MASRPGRRNRRTTSIRRSLFKSFLTLLLLISGSLLIHSMLRARQTIEELTAALFNETSNSVEVEMANFFAPISKAIEIVGGMGERGIFLPEDPETAGRLLLPVVEAIPQMSSVNTGDHEGNAFILTRFEERWMTVSIAADEEIERWRDIDGRGDTVRPWQEKKDFEANTRPWFLLGRDLSPGSIGWTEPYGFRPRNSPGITAVMKVDSPENPYVLAFDIRLDDLTRFTRHITVPGDGLAFVLTDDGRMLVPPPGSSRPLKDLLLENPEALGMPLVDACVRRRNESRDPGPFQVSHQGDAWWCGYREFPLSPQRKFWIVVMAPESHLLGERRRDQIALLLATTGALAVALVMALIISRSYSRPLLELVGHSRRLEGLHTGLEVRVDSHLREIGQLAEAQEKMRRALDSFSRYVPLGVVRDLFARGEAAKIGGEEAEVTVLFTDIAGFTTLAESMTPTELTHHMSCYFAGMVEILHRHGATVDKFIGDAIMAFWGAPNRVQDHSALAVEAVIEMREWLDEANRRWVVEGRPALPTRFGLAAGMVTVGNVGAEKRLSYTALGDTVNLACRLEQLNAVLGTTILADENVRRAAGNTFAWRDADSIKVRGKQTPVRIFELVGKPS